MQVVTTDNIKREQRKAKEASIFEKLWLILDTLVLLLVISLILLVIISILLQFFAHRFSFWLA